MSIKLMHTYHLNLLASLLDSSNARMPPLHTGPFMLHMLEQLLPSMTLMQPVYPTPGTRYTHPIGCPSSWSLVDWPLHVAYDGAVTVIQEFDVNLHTPLLVPDTPTLLATLPVGASTQVSWNC